jgi:hypothetical protein
MCEFSSGPHPAAQAKKKDVIAPFETNKAKACVTCREPAAS